MLPLPQCPVCGNFFSHLPEALAHLDNQHPSALRSSAPEPESQDSPSHPEADDPIWQTVEDAG